MPEIVWVVLYFLPALLVFRRCLRVFYEYNKREFPELTFDWDELFVGVFFSVVGAMVWPLVVVAALIHRVSRGDPERAINLLAAKPRPTSREAEMQERIDELEHALRIEQ